MLAALLEVEMSKKCTDVFRVAGAARRVRRSGLRVHERGCILRHQIFRFAKMILRNRCSTAYDLASLFVAGAVL